MVGGLPPSPKKRSCSPEQQKSPGLLGLAQMQETYFPCEFGKKIKVIFH